ncbi:HAD family hydrolase [Nonomuraea aurantiaca]|uniref:HAD family hydrolase n=1 Tax=Nonomuraea aurantiaca TaxID=2878562 RepID=UPI001CDA2DA6|nr:HAD family hydrolase [Nonomuraea aurantiaca]MCA2223890.1 HAD family hydrolase [Nonomuraea aurantiaca]
MDYGGTLTGPDFCPELGQRLVSPGAAAVLWTLHGFRVPLALGSNNRPGQSRRKALQAAGVLDLFAAVIESQEVGVSKPDPAFYRRVTDALGLPAAEIAMVGNNLLTDVTAPLACGFGEAFLIRPEGQLREGEDLPERGYVIDSISRLPALFRRPQ